MIRTAVVALVAVSLSSGAAAAAAPEAPVAPVAPVPGNTPAELASLEQKMATLAVTSERYTTTLHGSFRVTTESSGASSTCTSDGHCTTTHREHVVRHGHQTIDIVRKGESNLTARTGEQFDPHGHPALVVADSSLYIYAPEGTPRTRRRPWERIRAPGVQAQAVLSFVFPFYGAGSAEVNFGGTGAYAGLLNLLAIAEGPIVDGGEVVLHGRPTHRFSAQVQELKLTTLLPPKERVALEAATPPQRLEVFIDESGLPLRVVLTEVGKNGSFATTIDVLAVNIPVLVTAPSRRRTRLSGSSGLVSISTRTVGRYSK